MRREGKRSESFHRSRMNDLYASHKCTRGEALKSRPLALEEEKAFFKQIHYISSRWFSTEYCEAEGSIQCVGRRLSRWVGRYAKVRV